MVLVELKVGEGFVYVNPDHIIELSAKDAITTYLWTNVSNDEPLVIHESVRSVLNKLSNHNK